MNNMIENTHDLHDIRIDRDGVWYYRGAEMVRKDIVDLFYRHLRRDEKGRYLIELENDRAYVEVEDTPYIIKAVDRRESEGEGDVFFLLMPDGGTEKLDPSTLRIGDKNALYCTIAGPGAEARFSRPSYYQMAQYIEYDDAKEDYFISLNGKRYYLGKDGARL